MNLWKDWKNVKGIDNGVGEEKDPRSINLIKRAIRKLRRYDDDNLLQMMEDAKQEWEREKIEHPENAEKVECNVEPKFNALMVEMKARGDRLMSEEEYERREREEEEKQKKIEEIAAILPSPVRKGKIKYRKVAIVTVVVMIFGVGMGVVAVATPKYNRQVYPDHIGEKNVSLRNSSSLEFYNSGLEQAYNLIEDTLEIPVIAMDYIPDGMVYNEIIFAENYAVIKCLYKNQFVYLREKKGLQRDAVSTIVSDRKTDEKIINDWINQTLYVEEYHLDSGKIEYSVDFDGEEGSYYLSGVMSKEEFVKIIQNLYYR